MGVMLSAPETTGGPGFSRPPRAGPMQSLSARLLFLTVLFVMLIEVFVFVPSVARFRVDWLTAKVEAAHLAMLALDAAPDREIGEMLRHKLLSRVGARAVLARRGGARQVLTEAAPPMVDASFNLDKQDVWTVMRDALAVFLAGGDRQIRILATSSADPSVVIELVLDEAPLRTDMIGFGLRVLGLSILISLFTATLVFASLHWLLIRPLRRITGSMTAFSEGPEDVRRIIVPSGRRDEIGGAERQLESMQRGVRAALVQKAHLAALGTAVAKVNHDLKGILSSALLVSDRLEASDDPAVRKLAPTLVTAIERAAAMCGQTLDYVGRGQPDLKPHRLLLGPLIIDLQESLGAAGDRGLTLENRVGDGFAVLADRDHLYRIFGNLVGNAADAGASRVTVTAAAADGLVEIDIADDGHGLPERARENLFKPFEGSTRAGGTGLGLAIARELAQAHGGDLRLVSTGSEGTVFRLCLPYDD